MAVFGMTPEMVAEAVKSYTAVVVWMTISITVICFNKWLLAYAGFPYPLTLTMWHMFFCSSIAMLCVRWMKWVPSCDLSFDDYRKKVMPIGFLYALSLWLSNSAYIYLSVSFIQMTKSLMPGLVFICGIMFGVDKYRGKQAANMALIAFGVLVCAMGEINLIPIGLIMQLSALGFEASRLVLVQILIKGSGIEMNPIQSLYYVSPACLLCLSVPWTFMEASDALSLLTKSTVQFPPFYFLLNALAAFSLNLAVFMLIGKTSALTMNIAGVIKDWLLIFFSFFVFKAPLTVLSLGGYVFCCAGVFVYNWLKLQDMKKQQEQRKGQDVKV